MAEKCLIAASLAALVFHPSSTIKCFKSKCDCDTTTTPQKKKQPTPRNVSRAQSERSSPATPPASVVRTGSNSDEFSELLEGEWPIDIVETMFRSGWPLEKRVVVEKVLKVNHSTDVLSNFEEYREGVKSKSATNCQSQRAQKLMVDGNELLRFHAALITCSLGRNGSPSCICQNRWCAVCRIVSSTFPIKDASISFYENSWRAHGNIDSGSVADRTSARTAAMICRVIAGRVANYHELGVINGGEGGFDSVVSGCGYQSNGSEELVVLNQRAILPCFVVIYRAN